jgi:hypothetical protein
MNLVNGVDISGGIGGREPVRVECIDDLGAKVRRRGFVPPEISAAVKTEQDGALLDFIAFTHGQPPETHWD